MVGLDLDWRTVADSNPLAVAPQAAEPPLDGASREWRLRLWRDLSCAGALYLVAHFLFGVAGLGQGLPGLTLQLGVAEALFLVGTLLLWRVTRTLNEPVVARHPAQPKQAAFCLAIAMALSFSPCFWWLLSRAG